MRRNLLLLVAALFFVGGCGDDTVKPGGLQVRWTQGPLATCGSRHLVTVEARAYLKNVEQGSVESTCPSADRSGALILEELTPGNYTVLVEGFDADGKGVYLGTAERVAVKEGKTTTTTEIELVQKPVRLNVRWTPPSGRCAGDDVDEVEVNVYKDAGTNTQLAATDAGLCDAETPNPDDPGDDLAGLIFEGLDPNDDVVVIAYGLDAQGNKIAKAQSDPFILSPGDFAVQDLALETCPGDPPTCN